MIQMSYKEIQALETRSDIFVFGVPSTGDVVAVTFNFHNYMAAVVDKMQNNPHGEYGEAAFISVPEFYMVQSFR